MLAQKGIAFEDRDVSKSSAYLTELLDMGFQGTPVTIIGDERIQGYDRAKIEAALRD